MTDLYLNLSLEEVILKSFRENDWPIFNNASQVWNHTFYWSCLSLNSQKPTRKLQEYLERDFGSLEGFATQFHQAAMGQFGSGWAWLVLHQDRLEIVKTGNAHTPLTESYIPLLTCDVWEHAYYLDYQNRRGDYVTVFLEHLVNWKFVEENFMR